MSSSTKGIFRRSRLARSLAPGGDEGEKTSWSAVENIAASPDESCCRAALSALMAASGFMSPKPSTRAIADCSFGLAPSPTSAKADVRLAVETAASSLAGRPDNSRQASFACMAVVAADCVADLTVAAGFAVTGACASDGQAIPPSAATIAIVNTCLRMTRSCSAGGTWERIAVTGAPRRTRSPSRLFRSGGRRRR